MPEVEDMPGRYSTGGDHFPDALGEHRPGSREQRGIEVALQGIAMADSATSLCQRQPPIHTDDLRSRHTHLLKQLRRTNPEVDPRHFCVNQGAQYLS